MGSLLSFSARAAPPSSSKATQTEGNCPVCHSVHSDTTAVPCGHQLCLGCLLRHTATSATCPLCASPVLSARFAVQGQNEFLQCILSPAGEPPGPASWARRALFHLVYTQPRPPAPQAAPAPAEPAGPEPAEQFPADLWAELLHGHEHLLDPVRPWLRQSLDAIYGPQWWEARQVESIALSTLCICGPDRASLTHMLQGYLREYTAPLIHGLIHVTVHRCRDAWLRRRAQAAPEQQQQQEGESPAASAGPSSPGGTPALPPNQPNKAEPARLGGAGRALLAMAPAGQPQPWAGPDRHQLRAGPDQHQPWAMPQGDAPAPGPSAPWRGRRHRHRHRASRHSRRRRACRYRYPLKVRRRYPRRQ